MKLDPYTEFLETAVNLEEPCRYPTLADSGRPITEFLDVATCHIPYPGVVNKVFIKDGMMLDHDQTEFLVTMRVPNNVNLGLKFDTSSESEKLKLKKRLQKQYMSRNNKELEDDQKSLNPPPLNYGKQDVIQDFKTFDTVVDHSDHLFSDTEITEKHADWVSTVKEERRILEHYLPETIFVRVYESRMDILRAAIVGLEGTPYHNGLFFFDMLFPDDYPDSPPKVRYHCHGYGINPNLGPGGEVCLSLFNTALKEERLWVPGGTNILNLLISIQTLIFNPKPFFNAIGLEDMRGIPNWEFLALLNNENIIVKSLMIMAHTMDKPPKNFEDLVVGHFRKCLPDILMSCKGYMEGIQVGCLVNDDKHTCSLEFKNEVASCIKQLVDAFNKIGANGTQEFFHLVIKEKKNVVVVDDYMGDDGVNKKRKLQHGDVCHDDGSGYRNVPWKIRCRFPCLVGKVLVKEGMKIEPLQTLYTKSDDLNRFMASRPKPVSATRRILLHNHSSRIGIFSMEDVLMDQDGADPSSNPLARLGTEVVLEFYKNFEKFAYVVDHADHFYSARDSAVPKDLAGKIHVELRILEEKLPETDTIYVRGYKSRLDLLRAVIVGPVGTPYHGGLFFFDVCFPSDYPDSPPLLHYHSGGMGINPNLSKCGEVRLNLPTKSGGWESMWVPGTTTLLQLLVSIENQILNADPLFNEPAYAIMKGSSEAEHASFLYNETALIKSLKTMMYTMNKPPKNFEDFVIGHFRKQAVEIFDFALDKQPYTTTYLKDLRDCIKQLQAACNKTRPSREKLVCMRK